MHAGLAQSTYIHVDDTGARHQGKNGYCTHIGNELFAYFASTNSKSRVNFLGLLRALLVKCPKVVNDEPAWQATLDRLGIHNPLPRTHRN